MRNGTLSLKWLFRVPFGEVFLNVINCGSEHLNCTPLAAVNFIEIIKNLHLHNHRTLHLGVISTAHTICSYICRKEPSPQVCDQKFIVRTIVPMFEFYIDAIKCTVEMAI